MAKEIQLNYRETDEYKLLVDDCQSTITEGVFRSRQELIDTYKQLGERIYTDPLYIRYGGKKGIKGEISESSEFIQGLAMDIGRSVQVLHYAIQFYSKLALPDTRFSTAVENLGKNASWNKIRALLPEPKENKIELPRGKYQVILVDPPWPYPERQDDKNLYGAANYHYERMPIKDICNLPVKNLASENSVLFLWVATNFLEESFEVIKSWGFGYKSQMVWVKDGGQGGIGWYFWGDHEILLVATKGSFLPKEKVSSVLKAPRREHSKKPDEVYEIIEKMYPDNKYLELFARGKPRKGWKTWGKEVDA